MAKTSKEKEPLTFEYEKCAFPNARVVCGTDEAGRGPLAGPVYAAAVILDASNTDPELLSRLKKKGVAVVPVMLHVGLGTFRPVKEDNIKDHIMHSEYFSVSEESARIINERRAAGGRVICVGTTSTRTLESVALDDGTIPAMSGDTGIFIYPGYKFKAVDALITNFHLPESTLLMLVSAFYNRDSMIEAYETAVRERYRFFSFGDAMLIADLK